MHNTHAAEQVPFLHLAWEHRKPWSTANAFAFFFIDPATTEIYTLSLHDALPISAADRFKQLLESLRADGAGNGGQGGGGGDRKSTRLKSSHVAISYAVFCLKKKNNKYELFFPKIKKTKHANKETKLK